MMTDRLFGSLKKAHRAALARVIIHRGVFENPLLSRKDNRERFLSLAAKEALEHGSRGIAWNVFRAKRTSQTAAACIPAETRKGGE
jgi:hypothetical protein